MIDIQQFENIKQKHGSYASWALWAECGGNAKIKLCELRSVNQIWQIGPAPSQAKPS